MRKIAFISEHASPLAVPGGVDAGGQNVYVAQLARYLAKLKYSIDIFTRLEDPSSPMVVEWMPGVRVIHVKAGPAASVSKEALLPLMPEFRKNMLRFMQSEAIIYELIHANFFMSALVAMELNRILGIPYIVTYHALGKIRRTYQEDQDQFPLERLKIEEETALGAEAVIAECPQDQQDLHDLYSVPHHKMEVIPCGFCPSEFYPLNQQLALAYLGLPDDRPIILQLGRLVPRKGIDNVISALSLMRTTETLLLVVGGPSKEPNENDCPELKRLRQLAKDLGVQDKVIFTGQRARNLLKYYYSAADLFITTPWYEPFGITPLESMACGTPVIGANVGGIKYTVVPHTTGLLVPPKDPEALALAADQLLPGQRSYRRRLHFISHSRVPAFVHVMDAAKAATGKSHARHTQYHRKRWNDVAPFYGERIVKSLPALQETPRTIHLPVGRSKARVYGNKWKLYSDQGERS